MIHKAFLLKKGKLFYLKKLQESINKHIQK